MTRYECIAEYILNKQQHNSKMCTNVIGTAGKKNPEYQLDRMKHNRKQFLPKAQQHLAL